MNPGKFEGDVFVKNDPKKDILKMKSMLASGTPHDIQKRFCANRTPTC